MIVPVHVINVRSFGAHVSKSRSIIQGQVILSKNSEIFTQLVVIDIVTSTSSQSSSSHQFLSLYFLVGLLIFFVLVRLLYFSALYKVMNAAFSSSSMFIYFQTNGFFTNILAASEVFCACSVVLI
jgi:hypothetical protein